jgi:Mrp family chromosome partitioning ATPase
LTHSLEGANAAQIGEQAYWADRNLERETEIHPAVRAVPVSGFTSQAATKEELQLVQKLFFLAGHEAPRVVVFCGVEPTDRADLVCARVAEVLSGLVREPVCLMDANFRSPTLHRRYEIDDVVQTIDHKPENGSEQEDDAPGPYLWVLPAGSAEDGRPGITPDQLRDRLARLRKMFGFLLVSAPSLSAALDGYLLGQMADGVVLTLMAHSTRRATALKARSDLEAYNIRVLGAVLNHGPD